MAQVINTNILSLNAQRNLTRSQSGLQVALQRLSSGMRINSAKDDAAGLAISDRMTAQINGLTQAARNSNDGISLSQTAEAALGETRTLLQRMRELSIQSANATNSALDRAALQSEVSQLKSEVDRISGTAAFNGTKLLDGTFQAQSFQVGAEANQIISFSVAGASTTHLANNHVVGATGQPNNGTGAVAQPNVDIATIMDNSNGDASHPVVAQTLTIAGRLGTASVDINATMSANQIATEINKTTSSTAVSAAAVTDAYISNFNFSDPTAGGSVSLTLSTGATKTTISGDVTATDLTNLVSEINNNTGRTGIVATAENGLLHLRQADGKDIRIEDFASNDTAATINVFGANEKTTYDTDPTAFDGGVQLVSGSSNPADTNADSTVVVGTVNFNSESTFTVTSTASDAEGGVVAIATAGDQATSSRQQLSAVDISTVSGANDAISTIDSSLARVDRIVADLGALQNRFASTISNLDSQTESLQAARSRIEDTDFAVETANLTRSQILQQAGTAMLAQANSIPNTVLTLLRGGG